MASHIQDLHFTHVDIPITIDAIEPVFPAGPVPASPSDHLYLSNLDDMVGSCIFTPTVYFYPCDDPAAKKLPVGRIMRDALARVLVPYYPFSGRLRDAGNGKLEVYFPAGKSALFVKAHTSITIDELGELSVPNPAWAQLIHRFPAEGPYEVIGMPLVIAQVTFFGCGGFSLGLRLCHCLCDGVGAMQFVSAWAQAARDPTSSILAPVWDRESLKPRAPPRVRYLHHEFAHIDDISNLGSALSPAGLVQKCFLIDAHFQAQLKNRVQARGQAEFTTFDALAAHVWQCWVKALRLRPRSQSMRLTVSVNARDKLRDPPLKRGYYGNVIGVACSKCTVAELIDQPLEHVAGLVRAARLTVNEEYIRSMIDYIELARPKLEFAGKLTITTWTRFSLYEGANFGWGRPRYAGPADLLPTPQLCLFLPVQEGACPSLSPGSIMVCICLPNWSVPEFKQCLMLNACTEDDKVYLV
ncbi:Omega-hydroxypalmitate O-feruloyl transferase [Nymphaea thermarum]|nr:Omega-hydroxypalmitate O-feruloyl transferase [Nymphaea thermarum]